MRAFGFISLLITLAIVGYLMMNQTSGEGTNAGTAKSSEMAAERAANAAKLVELNNAVMTYHRTNEKWPPNLDAVVEAGFINRVPNGVKYDPETGAVTLETPQP
jgi:competence protein ComGC